MTCTHTILRSLGGGICPVCTPSVLTIHEALQSSGRTPAVMDAIALLTRTMPELPDEAGRVYFLLTADRTMVKIGKTRSPDGVRHSKLVGQSPVPLAVLGEVAGYTAVERWFHRRFAAYRTHGEWFRFEGEVRELLEHVVANGGHPCSVERDQDANTSGLGYVPPTSQPEVLYDATRVTPSPSSHGTRGLGSEHTQSFTSDIGEGSSTHVGGLSLVDAHGDMTHDDVIAERCLRSLSYFVRESWHIMMPGIPLLWNWHLEEICKHVQGLLEEWMKKQRDPLYEMKAQNLAINCPPRSLKSTIVSICAPAWMWLHWPSWKALFLSANPRVATRDALGCAALIKSEWYSGIRESLASRFAEGTPARARYEWTITRDGVEDFTNSAGGNRMAMGFTAVVVGLGGDAIFVDDPNDMKKVMSEAERAKINDTWDLSLCNRVNSYTDSIRFMIMQRGHELDLTGHWQATMPIERTFYLAMPLEYDPELAIASMAASPFEYRDPRTKVAQCLHPDRFPPHVIEAERKRLGPYGFAGQMNQAPVPLEGGAFKRGYWNFCKVSSAEPHHHPLRGTILEKLWRPLSDTKQGARPKGCDESRPAIPVPFLDFLAITVDATFGSLEDNASNVGLLCVGGKAADRFVLEDRTMARGFLDTCQAIRDLIRDFPAATIVLIEKKANGSAVIDTLKHEISGIIPIEASENWIVRANAMIPAIAAGNVYLLEGAAWNLPFVSEFGVYPNGAKDDRIDSLSQLMAHMAMGGYSLPGW